MPLGTGSNNCAILKVDTRTFSGTMKRFLGQRAPLVFLFLSIIVLFCLSTLLKPAHIEAITREAGWFGRPIVGLILLLTQVFAPLSGTPVMLAGIKLYGYPQAMGLLYASCMLSSVINFWIARRYGRTIVRRLVGRNALQKIDELSGLNERALLISARVLGYSFFDLISYAVGLTPIAFGKYFAYTAFLTLIPFTVQYFAFARLDFGSLRGMVIYFVSIAGAGAIFGRILFGIYFRKSGRTRAD